MKCDVAIRGGRVIDGTGAPALACDVAITDDRITGVGPALRVEAAREIDASGRIVAPGFIDAHTHDDRALLSSPDMTFKISQGVTTVVTGNCGVSLAPLQYEGRPPQPLDLVEADGARYYKTFGAYLECLDNEPPAVNAVSQVGHSTLRVGAMDSLDRPASADEAAAMRGALEAALADGACGFSTGLDYPPANAAPTEEVIALVEAVGAAGGFHSTHMRDEGDNIHKSLEETFRIGREGDAGVIISHKKCAIARNHGRSAETLGLIDAARTKQRVGFDVYPYAAASTMLAVEWVGRGSRTLVTWSQGEPSAQARDLDELMAEWGVGLEEAVARLQPAGAVYFTMDEADVRAILSHPAAMIGSDGLPHDAHPHPRLWGTFPRVLGHYSRDEGLFPLEEAVRKMTGLTAAQFGLTDRGVIRAGAYADITIFNPDTVRDAASFEAPKTPAEGVDLVMVNGRVAWEAGAHTGARAGRAMRGSELGEKVTQ